MKTHSSFLPLLAYLLILPSIGFAENIETEQSFNFACGTIRLAVELSTADRSRYDRLEASSAKRDCGCTGYLPAGLHEDDIVGHDAFTCEHPESCKGICKGTITQIWRDGRLIEVNLPVQGTCYET